MDDEILILPDAVDDEPSAVTEWVGEPQGKKVTALILRQGAQYIDGDIDDVVSMVSAFASDTEQTWLEYTEPKYGNTVFMHRNALNDLLFIGNDWIDLEAIKATIAAQGAGSIPILRRQPQQNPGNNRNHRRR